MEIAHSRWGFLIAIHTILAPAKIPLIVATAFGTRTPNSLTQSLTSKNT